MAKPDIPDPKSHAVAHSAGSPHGHMFNQEAPDANKGQVPNKPNTPTSQFPSKTKKSPPVGGGGAQIGGSR